MTRKRSAQSPEYAVSDEAAAYIADALMEIALQFEATHFRPPDLIDFVMTPNRRLSAVRCQETEFRWC
jgi:hypothetical protein